MPERLIRLLFVLLLLAGAGSLAWAQPEPARDSFGYEEGRILSLDEETRIARVQLQDGRIVEADMGQPLPDGAQVGPELPDYRQGQRVETYWYLDQAGRQVWAVTDWVRRPALWWLAGIFLLATIAIARLKGLRAFAATAVGLVIVISYIVPAILNGANPVLVSLLGTGGILVLAIYFVHGINWSTTAAVVGTFVAIVVTMVLGIIWTDLAHLTGFGSEDAMMISYHASEVNMRGLLLAGMLIGALGALTDVTIVQASVVRELAHTNPDMSARDLYRHGMNVGNDHIGSLVNTLVLAYAGTALPLLMLLHINGAGLLQTLNMEMVATEIVHTLVGSLGLILGVPLTTLIAALLFRGDRLKIQEGELHAHHHH